MAFLEIIMHEILSNYLRATHCFGLIESLAINIIITRYLRRYYYHIIKVLLVAKKKTGNENFPNVNLVLSICQLVVYFTISIK
jgi:hypothetical protein